MARPRAPHDVDWNYYYNVAEADAESGWNFILSHLAGYNIDTSVVLDFACGRGRIAEQCLPVVSRMILSDISEEAIDFCKQRFSALPDTSKIQYVLNTETSIPVPDASVTFLYSWDAMVHFDIEAFRAFMMEFQRILTPGGYGFVHHSNFGDVKLPLRHFMRHLLSRIGHTGFSSNPHWRSDVAAGDIRGLCKTNDLIVIKQEIIDWGGPGDRPYGQVKDLDCITIFRKPGLSL